MNSDEVGNAQKLIARIANLEVTVADLIEKVAATRDSENEARRQLAEARSMLTNLVGRHIDRDVLDKVNPSQRREVRES